MSDVSKVLIESEAELNRIAAQTPAVSTDRTLVARALEYFHDSIQSEHDDATHWPKDSERYGHAGEFATCLHPDCVLSRVPNPALLSPDRTREGWQPIATAPKEGTTIVLTDGKAVSVGGWIDAQAQGVEEYEAYLVSCGWWSLDLGENEPTLWQPLPPLPSAPPPDQEPT